MVDGAYLVDMGSLDERARAEVSRAMVLNQLLGRQCAGCGFTYDSESDVRNHGTLGGYGSDIVGKGSCWNTYVERNVTPDQRRGTARVGRDMKDLGLRLLKMHLEKE